MTCVSPHNSLTPGASCPQPQVGHTEPSWQVSGSWRIGDAWQRHNVYLKYPPMVSLGLKTTCRNNIAAATKSLQLDTNSVWPHRWQPTRLPHPWDSPGKNTGVDCHFLLQCMKVKSESEVVQLFLTLHDPMDCSPPGSSGHGIFQARVLEWGAIAFSSKNTLVNSNYNVSIGAGSTCFCKRRGWRRRRQTALLTQ